MVKPLPPESPQGFNLNFLHLKRDVFPDKYHPSTRYPDPMRFFLTLGLLSLLSPSLRADEFADATKALFQKHCYSCHGEKKQKGDITLHDLDSLEAAFQKHALLDNIIDQIESGDMPPDDEDVLPTDAERKQLIDALSKVSERIRSGNVPQKAGRVTLRRLNRNEYHYTVRDLFGVNFNPSQDFPADGAGGEGFDNTADALFSSPALLEKYLSAAKKVIANVYANPGLKTRAIFIRPKTPKDAEATAKKVLGFHATLAYRRRVSDDDLAPLINAFKRGKQAKMSFDNALRAPLTALLINPRFLFRAEHNEAGKDEWKLNDFEIATRLSYFLWSSMPDRELFRLADAGKLSDPAVLKAQTLRMIASPKSTSLARHFAGQWIGFDKIVSVVDPDQKRFPAFNDDLRKAMYYESVEFFSHVLQKNRPITDFIDSDYTFANATLARHYGLKEKVTGKEMKKVRPAQQIPRWRHWHGQRAHLNLSSAPYQPGPARRLDSRYSPRRSRPTATTRCRRTSRR